MLKGPDHGQIRGNDSNASIGIHGEQGVPGILDHIQAPEFARTLSAPAE